MYPIRLLSDELPASSPSTRSEPDVITWTPTIDRISVDLPLPLGPSNPVTTPARTVADRSSNAGRPPRTTRRRLLTTADSADMEWFLTYRLPEGIGSQHSAGARDTRARVWRRALVLGGRGRLRAVLDADDLERLVHVDRDPRPVAAGHVGLVRGVAVCIGLDPVDRAAAHLRKRGLADLRCGVTGEERLVRTLGRQSRRRLRPRRRVVRAAVRSPASGGCAGDRRPSESECRDRQDDQQHVLELVRHRSPFCWVRADFLRRPRRPENPLSAA